MPVDGHFTGGHGRNHGRGRARLGVTPLQFQVQLRMKRARELLAGTDPPIAVIARETGYDYPMYFSRRFARIHGTARPRIAPCSDSTKTFKLKVLISLYM
ncbi:AraC family transcriptional regulator [Glycomyces luteolus]|uniref:AraC family transcriptional regulator n=1 Tax=Glycomyces luteolus TaxID=2670330 RepID=A0A9X3P7M2_9ACTN|nr:AraC family transcriptional regulator [Glycomyces luteolus]MDA1358403.1 AraC family transcriptional regulator [Glycomyces luteolus]